MEHTRTNYSAEEKQEIIFSILTKKSSIQQISKEKGIAPTLISLWKKQAMDAMFARFQAQPKGRPKIVREEPAPTEQLKEARHEARNAKIKAAHLENSLRETREKLAQLEEQLKPLVALLGYRLEREKAPRKPRKPRNE